MEVDAKRSSAQTLILYDRLVPYETSTGSGVSTDTSAALAFSSDGSILAVSPAGSSASYIFSAQRQPGRPFKAPSAVFDSALHAKGGTTSDSVDHLAWSSDGSRLAIATRQGCLHIVTREGQLLTEWGPTAPWGRLGIVGLCFAGRQSAPLALTSKGMLLELNSPAEPPAQLVSLAEYHRATRCMTYIPATSELVVVGDDGTAEASRVSITAWTFLPGGQLEMAWRFGAPGGTGWLSWGRKLAYAGWEAHADPGGTRLAVTMPGQRPLLLDLPAARAGQAVLPSPWTPPDVPDGAVSQVAWWDESTLAAVSPSGLCIVSNIDPAFNLLTPAARPFAAGTRIACQLGQADGQPRLLAIERAATSEGEQQAGWRLVLLEQRSAEAKLEQLVAAEQWEAAMMLATSHGLDPDLIHKALWAGQPVGEQSLHVSWRAIADRQWAVRDCLVRVEPTAQAQSLLLQAGLQETEAQLAALEAAGQHGGGPSGDERATELLRWRSQRLMLLQHMDRLATLLELHSGSYSESAFEDFRESSLTDVACSLAAMSELDSLAVLLRRHPCSLAPRLLEVLRHLPETLPPAQLLPLLAQACQSDAPDLPRSEDGVESAATCKQLREDGQYALLVATEPMARLSIGWQPPTPAQVADWFVERAQLVDAVFGQVALVVDILDAGCRFVGEPAERLIALKACAEELQDVASAGAAAGAANSSSWVVTLEQYAALGTVQRMQLLLRDSSPGSVHGDRARLAALLARLLPKERGPQLAVLLVHMASTQLSWCCELVRLEAKAMQVFESATDLADAVLACVYAYQGVSGWDMLASMLAASLALLRAVSKRAEGGAEGAAAQDGWEKGWEEDGEADPKAQHLAQQVEQAQQHVAGAELLAELGLPVPLAELQTGNPEKALRMVRTLLARLSRSQPPMPDSRWTDVWRQLRALQETAWPFLTKQDLLVELCGSLLRCGTWRLARSYLTSSGSTPLHLELAEQIVVSAGREYFYSASSLDAPEILQAQQCLGVLPDSAAARAELDSVAAILRLRDFGVEMLPMQFQEVTDRMEILQAALDAQPGAHANRLALSALAAQLGLADRASELQNRIAAAALREGDLAAAREACLDLVRAGYSPAWELATQLALLNAAKPERGGEGARDMLAFAMAHCSPDQFDELARLWHTASWQPTIPARAPKDLILSSLQPVKRSLLPEFGDVPAAFDALLDGNQEGWSALQQGLEEAEGNHALTRRLLLLGMFAASFRALLLATVPEGNSNTAAAEAEHRLNSSPWQLHDQAQAAGEGTLHPDVLRAKRAAREYRQRLADAADEHRMEALLPLAGAAASNGDGMHANVTREAALMQVATAAGKLGPGSEGEAKLRQALGLAERYKVDAWALRMAYLQALLTQSRGPVEATAPLAKSLLTHLLQLPQSAQGVLSALLGSVYPSLAPTQHSQYALCLNLIAKCLEAGQGNATAGLLALQAAKAFTEQCSTIAPQLNARVFIDPLVAVANGGAIPGSCGPQARAAQMERELVANVAHENVTQVAEMLQRIGQAGQSAGFAFVWPPPTSVYGLMFGKGLEGAASSENAAQSYARVRAYLGHMEPADIVSAVKQVAERRMSSGITDQAKRLAGQLWPRALRLQALRDGSAALRASDSLDAARLLPQLVALEAAVAQASSVEQNCKLASEQLEALEAELVASGDGNRSASAGLQLLLTRGVDFGKVRCAAESLVGPSGAEADASGVSSGLSQDASILEAAHEAVKGALRRIGAPATDTGERGALVLESPLGATDPVQQLVGVVRSLEEADGEEADAVRNVVWELLQDFVANQQNVASSEAGMQAVELLASLLPADDKPSRWPGWAPTTQEGSSPAAVALWSRSLALLGPHWPHAQLLPADFASRGAAEAAFMRLLAQASGPDQLALLGKLLAEVWRNGAAFPNGSTTEQPGSAEEAQQPAHEPPAPAVAQQSVKLGGAGELHPSELAEGGAEDGWDMGPEMLAETPLAEIQAMASSSQQRGEPRDEAPAALEEFAEEGEGWGEGWDEGQLDLDLEGTAPLQEAAPPHAASGSSAGPHKAGHDGGDAERVGPDAMLQQSTGAEGASSGNGLEVEVAAAEPAWRLGGEEDGGADGWEGDEHSLDLLDIPIVGAHSEEPIGQGAEGDRPQQHAEQAVSPCVVEQGSGAGDGVSSLHRCWAALLERQVCEGAAQAALRMLDWASCSLVTSQEASYLVQQAKATGAATSITLALLLPYDDVSDSAIHQLLSPETSSQLQPDDSLLLVLLARGLFPILATAACFAGFCRLLLAQTPGQGSSRGSTLALTSWRGLLVPSAAAALCLNGGWAAASGLVARHLGLHPALISVENGLLLLPRLFRAHMRLHEESAQPPWAPEEAPLPKTAVIVWKALPDLCQRALIMLEQR